jgi:hypothetical protein
MRICHVFRDALSQQAEPQIRLVDGDWPIIALGYGRVEVAEGWQGETHALIFGRNGMGQIGAPTQPDRVHLPGETLAVITFANVESLDVVAGKLAELREKLGLSKQEPQAQITYAHPSNPSGPRFNQRANDPLPTWAVDVRPEPQAQAGEPEVVAFRQWVEAGPKLRDYWMLANPDMKSRCLPQGNWEELITLQAHREAMAEVVESWTRESTVVQQLLLKLEVALSRIAKKDAALKACVEALKTVDVAEYAEIDSAITQGQGALKP